MTQNSASDAGSRYPGTIIQITGYAAGACNCVSVFALIFHYTRYTGAVRMSCFVDDCVESYLGRSVLQEIDFLDVPAERVNGFERWGMTSLTGIDFGAAAVVNAIPDDEEFDVPLRYGDDDDDDDFDDDDDDDEGDDEFDDDDDDEDEFDDDELDDDDL